MRLNNINVLFIILLQYTLHDPPDAVSPPFLRGRQQHASIRCREEMCCQPLPRAVRSRYPLAAIHAAAEPHAAVRVVCQHHCIYALREGGTRSPARGRSARWAATGEATVHRCPRRPRQRVQTPPHPPRPPCPTDPTPAPHVLRARRRPPPPVLPSGLGMLKHHGVIGRSAYPLKAHMSDDSRYQR